MLLLNSVFFHIHPNFSHHTKVAQIVITNIIIHSYIHRVRKKESTLFPE